MNAYLVAVVILLIADWIKHVVTANNMGNLTPHPFKVFVEYSHPPLRERIRALQAICE